MEIKLNNISTKNFFNFNLNFTQNKINTLIGNNNSAIKEIFNLIYGEEKIEEGYIKICTKKMDTKTSKKNILDIKKDVFYIKEDSEGLLFNINILEDIKYYVKKIDNERLYELLKMFNLDNNIFNKNYLELSNSETRKILLIIALMMNSRILILDNPILNLDNKSVQSLVKLLKKQKRENKIIIVTSYDMDFLLQISDRVWVIKNNEIIKEADKFEIFSDAKLLDEVNIKVPYTVEFVNKVRQLKNIKFGYRDNINDLLKDIYRYAK